MGYPVPMSDITTALRTLTGYLDDLARASFDHAATKMRLVVNYAQKDEVVRSLAELLRVRMPTEAFLARAMGERLDVPAARGLELAFAYGLLFHLKQGHRLNLRELLSRGEFAGGGMDERWKRFVARFVEPLRDELRRLSDALREEPASDARVEPSEVFARAFDRLFGAESEGRAGEVAPAPAAARAPSPASAPAAGRSPLRAAVAAVADASLRANLEVDARLLELELSKQRPDPTRVQELVADLASGGAACAQAARERAGLAAAAEATPAPVDEADVDALRRALEAERATVARLRAELEAARFELEAVKGRGETERLPILRGEALEPVGNKKAATKKRPATKKQPAPTKKAAAPNKPAGKAASKKAAAKKTSKRAR